MTGRLSGSSFCDKIAGLSVVYRLALSPQPLRPICCSSLVSGSFYSNMTQSVGREVNCRSFRFSRPFSGIVPHLCPSGTPLLSEIDGLEPYSRVVHRMSLQPFGQDSSASEPEP